MNWYLAKMVYRIVSGNGSHKPQFDEQLRIIRAADQKQAYDKVISIGRSRAESFLNHKQQLVRWEFVNIAELYRLPALDDGVEIYSHLLEADNAGAFIEITNDKAEQIRSSALELTTELI